MNKEGNWDELLKFHSKYYSSNIMSLAVYSKLKLDELEELVKQCFSSIKNLDIEPKSFLEETPYDSWNLGYLYKIIPTSEFDYLEINFPIPYS